MKLVTEKTNFIIMNPQKIHHNYNNPCSIMLNNCSSSESKNAEHLGIVRNSNTDNLMTNQNLISKHTKSLLPVLSSGSAREHLSYPAASLKIEELYSSPVKFSDLAFLVLNRSEINILSLHQK